MSNIVDMCRKIKNNSLHFTLNPDNNWSKFNSKFNSIINSQWHEIKFLSDLGTSIHPSISSVPNDMGGIYLFLLRPDIVPHVHKYILYVGRVQYSEQQNLRKRFREYIKDDRADIQNMRESWGKELYIRYLPLTDNEIIRELETELLKAVIPPCNDQYPGILNKAMRAAF